MRPPALAGDGLCEQVRELKLALDGDTPETEVLQAPKISKISHSLITVTMMRMSWCTKHSIEKQTYAP